MSDLNRIRARFAEEVGKVAQVRSEAMIRAFARVPREKFIGPGPWLTFEGTGGWESLPDANPERIYRNITVGIDTARMINNGQPGFLAQLIDALEVGEGRHVVHVGCGMGYYSAILAEIVGAEGFVTAIEIDPVFAERARVNLARYSQIRVVEADGGTHDPGNADAILVNAGVTHPQPMWLDRLRVGGRLVLPLTAIRPEGAPAWVTRIVRDHAGAAILITRGERGYAARMLTRTGIGPLVGGRDAYLQSVLKDAFAKGEVEGIRSLRRDSHAPDAHCWYHGPTFCFSRLPPPG